MLWRGMKLLLTKNGRYFGITNKRINRNIGEKIVAEINSSIRCYCSYRYNILCDPLTFVKEEEQ